MKTIIAGSRGLSAADTIVAIVSCWWANEITEVVCGCAEGPDTHGAEWAELVDIPVKKFSADWKRHGRRAGILRNQEMAAYADALLLVWDGASRGSANMLKEATRRGLRVHVHNTGGKHE